MKKTFRVLSLLLAAALLMACAAGCSSSGSSASSAAASSGSASAAASASAASASASASAIASASASAAQSGDKHGGMLTIQCWSDPTNINFYADNGSMGGTLYGACGAMLCSYDADQNIIPQLLESWELSDDSLTWTFHMRENACWSDGQPITADDVIFSIDYFRQTTFSDVVFQRDTDYFTEAPVYAKVDDHTYTVTTTVPYPTIFDYYIVNFFVLPEHVFKDVPAAEFHTTKVNTTPGQIVCGGPFMVTEYKVGEYVKCERNPYYWDDVYLDELYFRIAADTESMFTALMSGDLDFSFGTSAKYDEAVAAGMQVVKTNSANFSGYAMNTKDAILSDVNIRRAFSYIYDQQLLIDQVYGGQAEYNKGFAKGVRFEDDDACVSYSHDLDKAKQLIESSGWALGDDGYYYKDGKCLEVTFAYETGYDDVTAMVLQTMFQNTGVKFNITGYENSVLYDMLQSGQWQMAPVYATLGPDPANYYGNYKDDSTNYLFGNYRSDTLDQDWKDGMSAADDAGRQKAYSAMWKELTDQAVWLVLPKGWGYYYGDSRFGMDEAQFTSYGMFVYYNKLYVKQ